jgi:hypothetical protein
MWEVAVGGGRMTLIAATLAAAMAFWSPRLQAPLGLSEQKLSQNKFENEWTVTPQLQPERPDRAMASHGERRGTCDL